VNARDRAVLKREGAAGAARLLREEEAARLRRLAKSLPRRKAAAVEDAAELAAKRAMHDDVFAWNLANTTDELAPHGRCDCGCGGRFSSEAEGECDHWIERSQGGPHTRANGWRLLPRCHHKKTGNVDRPGWNLKRARYCVLAAIPYVERRVR
jgi:5-methylcytosine-specific restriction endonuclease McrA